MASTSTGYNKSVISREQPSSSGQVMSWTSGCILNIQAGAEHRLSGKMEIKSGSTMDIESGGKFTVASGGKVALESGSTMDIESGGKLTIASGAKFAIEDISAPTKLSTKLSNCGVSYITTGGGVYYLADPDQAGLRKTIIALSTEIICVVAGTSVGKGRFGTSKECCIGITNVKLKKGMGLAVDLISIGNSTWFVLSQSSAQLTSVASASSALNT